jgi:hypothetical protein
LRKCPSVPVATALGLGPSALCPLSSLGALSSELALRPEPEAWPPAFCIAVRSCSCSSLCQAPFCGGSGVHMVCKLTAWPSIDASGGVAADPQRGTESRLLSTECTEPDRELVWHCTGASLRGIQCRSIERAREGLRSTGTRPRRVPSGGDWSARCAVDGGENMARGGKEAKRPKQKRSSSGGRGWITSYQVNALRR